MGLRVPISWLNDYVKTSNTETLAERLTLAGLEIEMVEVLGQHWEETLVAGEILAVAPHPNADRLSLVSVNAGTGTPLDVVCGAENIRAYENQSLPAPLKVPLALPGAVLMEAHGDEGQSFKVKGTKIRGVASQGVLCSEKELGLSEEHEGVMLLPQEAPAGSSLKALLGDEILHFDIKGGFSHLLSIYGIAREAAALTGAPLQREVMAGLEPSTEKTSPHPPFVKLEIEARRYCSRYSALLIEGVKVAPSPFWMQQRLLRAGMRPINNIVDITNYVMLEMGQPLHAFDYDLLRQRQNGEPPTLCVRCAHPGETMKTLDGVERNLDEQMMLITDGQGAIAIAGVMGGMETEVSESTTRILLEAANFEFLNNRRTAQLLKLPTEASERFGKRLDPEWTLATALRAAQLMAEHAGGTLHEVYGDLYVEKQKAISIDLKPQYVHRLLGIELSPQEIIQILEKLEFQVTPGDPLQVKVPSHRMDVTLAADLVEEIARIYGYNKMAGTLMKDEMPPFHPNAQQAGTETIRDLLVRIGLDEIITYSIVDLKGEAAVRLNESIDPAHYIGLKNPLSADRTHMRRSLLPGLLKTAQKNLRSQERVAIFEIGSLYRPKAGQLLPEEPQRLTLLMTGARTLASWKNNPAPESMDFYDIKGVVQSLLAGLHVQDIQWRKQSGEAFHPGRCAEVWVNGHAVGLVGELHPKIRQRFDLPEQSICLADLDLQGLLACWNQEYSMQELSIYEPIYEDFAFVVEESVAAGEVASLILESGHPLLEKIELFDVFRGERVGVHKKSLAYALTYQSHDRTLTDQDIKPIREKIIGQLKEKLNAELRA